MYMRKPRTGKAVVCAYLLDRGDVQQQQLHPTHNLISTHPNPNPNPKNDNTHPRMIHQQRRHGPHDQDRNTKGHRAARPLRRRERLPEAQRPELAAREQVEVQRGRDDHEEEREDLRGGE